MGTTVIHMRWVLMGAVFLSGCAASPYSTDPNEFSGVRTYQTFCASCHGLGGRGDGPVQPFVHNVPDLTQLARRNDGKFPTDEVRQIIDGRKEIGAHGTRKMPVWGWEFYGGHDSDAVERARTDRTINRLVDYLESIQAGYKWNR